MVSSLILYYFMIYAVLIAVWVGGYFILQCILKKRSATEIWRILLTHKYQCDELYNRIKLNDSQKMQEHQLQKEYDIISQKLSEIHRNLEKSNSEQSFRIKKSEILRSTHIVLIGQFIKIFILTTIILLLSGCSCIISFISISIVSHLRIPKLASAVYEFCNIRIEEFGIYPYGMYFGIIFAVIFLLLTAVFIRKAIRLLTTQYDILFMACQLSGMILFPDQLNENAIAEEFHQMEKNIQINNSSSRIGKILHSIFD